MSTKTKNLNLIKPEENDYVNIKDINNNMDIIDEKLATESKKIDGMLSGTASSVEIVTVQSRTIRNNSASGLVFKISSKDNETLQSIKDKSPTIINANVIAKSLDGVDTNNAGIPSSYNVESTKDEYSITVYSGSSSVAGQYLFAAVVTIAYKRDINDIRLAELKNMCIGEDGTVYDNAGDALRGQIGQLKESIDEKLIHIKSKNLINVTKAVKGYRENYNAQIVKNDAYAYIRVDVDPNTTYTVSESIARNVFIYQLSSGKGILPAYSIGYPDKSVTFTTDEKTDQISFNFEIPAIDSIQMEKGTSATDYEAFFDFYRSKDIDYLSKKEMYDTLFKGLLTKKSSKNLIDQHKILKGKRFDENGETYDQSGYDSIRVNVSSGTIYTLSNSESNNGNMFVTGKDINNKTTFSTNREYPNDYVTFTTTDDTSELLLSFESRQTKTIQLENNPSKTNYEEYYSCYTLPESICDEIGFENRNIKKEVSEIKMNAINATEYLSQEEELIKKVQDSLDADSIVFTLVTDVHGTNKNNGYVCSEGYKFNNNFGYKNFKEFARIVSKMALNTSSDFIVNLGDTINSTSDEAYLESNSEVPEVNKEEIKHRYAEFTRFICYDSVPYFTCNAHHEMFPLENENHLSKSEIVGIAGRKNKCIEKIYDDESDKNYYFFDIRNVRFIVLDSVCDTQPGIGRSYSAEELSWLKNIALNTEHNVVVFSHVATRDNLGTNIYSGGEELAKILNDFHNENHKILAFYHGHTHFDNIVLPNESGDKFPYISTEKSWCTTYTPDTSSVLGQPTTYERNYNTYEEYCIDVNVLNSKNGKINIFRFGAGNDRTVN